MKLKFKIINFVATFFILPFFAQAMISSELILHTNDMLVSNKEADVSVILKVDGNDNDPQINAFTLNFEYPKDKLKFISFDNSGSQIDIWQTEKFETNKIYLSGGIFSGIKSGNFLLLKIKFKVISPTDISFKSIKSEVYLADGKGTRTLASFLGKIETLKEDIQTREIKNNKTPEFYLKISKESIGGNNLIIVYPQNGEVNTNTQTRFKKWFIWSEWVDMKNALVFPKDSWIAEVRVMSIDKEYISKTIIDKKALFVKFIEVIFVGSSLAILSFTLYNILKRK